MDILQNPFCILGATPRDNRHSIESLAEQQSLLSETDACRKAREVLTNPRKRIAAEIAWLPGVEPDRASDMLMLLEASAGSYLGRDKPIVTTPSNSPSPTASRSPDTAKYNIADKVLESLKVLEGHFTDIERFLGIDRLTPLTRSNLLAARIARLPESTPDTLAKWILAIAETYQAIDPTEVRVILNNERKVSGFPEITDLSVIVAEIRNRRLHYQHVIQLALENILPINERVKVVMEVIESSTHSNTDRWPILIEDAVDAYEKGAEAFLESEVQKLETLNRELRVAVEAGEPDHILTPLVRELTHATKNWGAIAQPIQKNRKRQGLRHAPSHDVVNRVQQLAVLLFSEYDKLDYSGKILKMLQGVFTEIPEIVERIGADLETLDTIAKRRNQMNF